MRRKIGILVLALALSFSFPVATHAAGAAAAAVSLLIYIQQVWDSVMVVTNWIAQARQMMANVTNTYHTMLKMLEVERRAIENLLSIGNIRSIDDFSRWMNRTMFLAREQEHHFNNLRFDVGNNSFTMREINEIPAALRENFSDPFNRNFTDEDRRRFWLQYGGLTAGNYAYMRTWQQRNQQIADMIMSRDAVLNDEFDEAAARNQAIMNEYSAANEQLHEKEILMNTHITAMNTEMAVREQTRLMLELHQYQLSRDRMEEMPPTPPRLSDQWNHDPFMAITQGRGESTFSDW